MWWEILELTAEADQKAIKLAYAKKLKQTRPDADPEGFKALHAAYKQALAWHANKVLYADKEDDWNDEWEDEPQVQPEPLSPLAADIEPASLQMPTEQTLDSSENLKPETKVELVQIQLAAESPSEAYSDPLQTTVLKAPLVTEPNTEIPLKNATLQHPLQVKITQEPATQAWIQTEDQFAADWRQFQRQLSINIHTEAARKQLKDWAFLEQLPSFMDLEFRERLSLELFGLLSESNLKAAEQKTLFIKAPVLQYLNQLFAWEEQWRFFTERFGEPQADAILLHIETQPAGQQAPKPVQPEQLYYYPRFLAFVIDILIIVGIGLFPVAAIELPFKVDTGVNTVFLFVVLWFFLYPMLECSQWEGSLGKQIMGLKVVNKRGQRLSVGHAYIRNLVTSACILGFKIVVWINILLAYKRSMLFQDWLTQSYVIKRQ